MNHHLEEIVRGVYVRGEGDTWALMPMSSRVRPWRDQHALPQAFRHNDDTGVFEPLTAEGAPDDRFPRQVNMALVLAPAVQRAHFTHTLRGPLALGSLYLYAPTPTERWVELLTKAIDYNDKIATRNRLVALMGNDDEVAMNRHAQTITTLLFTHTPVTIHRPTQLLVEK